MYLDEEEAVVIGKSICHFLYLYLCLKVIVALYINEGDLYMSICLFLNTLTGMYAVQLIRYFIISEAFSLTSSFTYWLT